MLAEAVSALQRYGYSSTRGKLRGLHHSEFKISRQLDDYSCGSRCVYMVLRHRGRSCTHTKLKKDLKTDPQEGTSELTMRKVFRRRGIHAKVRKLNWRKLLVELESGAQVIVTVDEGEHYIVVHGYGENTVHVADPIEYRPCRRTMTRQQFLDRWDYWGLVIPA
jgi:ABC-type bacteriocin/lantibiotic exporter with double-glycine peptidase domain